MGGKLSVAESGRKRPQDSFFSLARKERATCVLLLRAKASLPERGKKERGAIYPVRTKRERKMRKERRRTNEWNKDIRDRHSSSRSSADSATTGGKEIAEKSVRLFHPRGQTAKGLAQRSHARKVP